MTFSISEREMRIALKANGWQECYVAPGADEEWAPGRNDRGGMLLYTAFHTLLISANILGVKRQ